MNKLFISLLCLGFVGFSAPGFSTFNSPVTTSPDSSVNRVTTTTTTAPQVTTVAADQDIANQVKEAFKRDPSLQNDFNRVTVTVKDKEVILSGKVADKNVSNRMEDVASKVQGVSDVDNNLEIAK